MNLNGRFSILKKEIDTPARKGRPAPTQDLFPSYAGLRLYEETKERGPLPLAGRPAAAEHKTTPPPGVEAFEPSAEAA